MDDDTREVPAADLASLYPIEPDRWKDRQFATPSDLAFLSLGIDPVVIDELMGLAGDFSEPSFGKQETEYRVRLQGIQEAVLAGQLKDYRGSGRLPRIKISSFILWARRRRWTLPGTLVSDRQPHRGKAPGIRPETAASRHDMLNIAKEVLAASPQLSRNSLSQQVAARLRARGHKVNGNTVRNSLFYQAEAPWRGGAWDEACAEARKKRRAKLSVTNGKHSEKTNPARTR